MKRPPGGRTEGRVRLPRVSCVRPAGLARPRAGAAHSANTSGAGEEPSLESPWSPEPSLSAITEETGGRRG